MGWDRGAKRGEMEYDRKRVPYWILQRDERKIEEVEKKVKLLIVLFFPSHLLLCVTHGGQLWNEKTPYDLFPTSFSPLSNIGIFYRISMLICLHSPPLQSPTAPPPCIFFLSDSSAGGPGQLRGGVIAIRQCLEFATGWEDEEEEKRRRRRM